MAVLGIADAVRAPGGGGGRGSRAPLLLVHGFGVEVSSICFDHAVPHRWRRRCQVGSNVGLDMCRLLSL